MACFYWIWILLVFDKRSEVTGFSVNKLLKILKKRLIGILQNCINIAKTNDLNIFLTLSFETCGISNSKFGIESFQQSKNE